MVAYYCKSIPFVNQTKWNRSQNSMSKKERGQFYTTNAEYILDGLELPLNEDSVVIEPFAGQGDLLEWLKKKNYQGRIQSYDIEPKIENVVQRDTLKNPVDYNDAWIITNPPYLARNKCANKEIYDQYQMNDLGCAVSLTINSRW